MASDDELVSANEIESMFDLVGVRCHWHGLLGGRKSGVIIDVIEGLLFVWLVMIRDDGKLCRRRLCRVWVAKV